MPKRKVVTTRESLAAAAAAKRQSAGDIKAALKAFKAERNKFLKKFFATAGELKKTLRVEIQRLESQIEQYVKDCDAEFVATHTTVEKLGKPELSDAILIDNIRWDDINRKWIRPNPASPDHAGPPLPESAQALLRSERGQSLDFADKFELCCIAFQTGPSYPRKEELQEEKWVLEDELDDLIDTIAEARGKRRPSELTFDNAAQKLAALGANFDNARQYGTAEERKQAQLAYEKAQREKNAVFGASSDVEYVGHYGPGS